MKIKMNEEVQLEVEGRWNIFKKGVTYDLTKKVAEKLLDKAKAL